MGNVRKKTCVIVYSFDCEDHGLYATKSSQMYLSTSAPLVVRLLVHAEKSSQQDIAISVWSLNSNIEAQENKHVKVRI